MDNTETAFGRKIDEEENNSFKKSGNIQMHNSVICRNFEYFASIDSRVICDDEFYSKLQKAVSKNELSRSPLLPSIIMDVFALLFIFICLSLGFKIKQVLIFIALPAFMFCYFTYSIIKESVKLHIVMKCVKQRENINAVSLKIDGKRLFTDTSRDVSKDYYVYSEPMLICVPKELYYTAAPDKSLVGAVIDTGRRKFFYALYVI